MAAENRGQRQDRGRHNGGEKHTARETMHSMGDQIREGAGQVGEHLSAGYDSARDEMSRRYRMAERTMAENPAPSLLIGFGVGFGLGLVLTTLLSREEETWSDWGQRHARDTMRHARDTMHQARDSARDSARHMPEMLQSLADSIRTLPDAISRSMSRH